MRGVVQAGFATGTAEAIFIAVGLVAGVEYVLIVQEGGFGLGLVSIKM